MDEFHFLRPWTLVLVVPAILLWFAGRSAGGSTRLSSLAKPGRWRRLTATEGS